MEMFIIVGLAAIVGAVLLEISRRNRAKEAK